MKNIDKLKPITKSKIRENIRVYGSWNGVVKYRMILNGSYGFPVAEYIDKLVYATLTNYASLNDPNLLEFYNLP